MLDTDLIMIYCYNINIMKINYNVDKCTNTKLKQRSSMWECTSELNHGWNLLKTVVPLLGTRIFNT